MKMRIDHYLDDDFLQEGLKLFLVNNIQPKKAEFLTWVRTQVGLFGSDEESCWGQVSREIPDDFHYYWNKWFTDKQ